MLIHTSKFLFILILSYVCCIDKIEDPISSILQAENEKIVLIPENSSTRTISSILKTNNIISFSQFFILCDYVIGKLFHIKLKSGEYMFHQNEGIINALKKIYEGKSIIRKITFAEGLSVRNIIQTLNENPYLKGEIKEEIEEGSMFPSTYYYFYGTDRNVLVQQMVNKMNNILQDLQHDLDVNGPITNSRELLILASIVERESKYDSDKQKIASILIQRLKINMKLQVDSTIIYFLSKGKYNITRNLNFDDLKVDSKFNSYKFLGLPPTPICCPGLVALKSVLNPPQTDYLYFLSTQSGEIIYNKTLQEHVISKNLQKNLYFQNK